MKRLEDVEVNATKNALKIHDNNSLAIKSVSTEAEKDAKKGDDKQAQLCFRLASVCLG